MRYQHTFLCVIPQIQAGCSRVTHPSAAKKEEQAPLSPLDLHVLSTPPAFVLSQNQTLKFNYLKPSYKLNCSNDFRFLFCVCLSFNDCLLKYILYFKDFDRNFQNNYYFVLFPSIQFLNNSRQHRLTFALAHATAYIYQHIYFFKSSIFSRFFKKFF